MRVLLVDDEVEYVSTLAERLSFRGIDASWVSSAKDALERIRQESFDIAVLDVKMPKMGGIELKQIIEEINPDFPTRTKGVVEKCNLCAERLAKGLQPACVEVSEGAIVVGDLEDPNSEVRALLNEKYSIRRKQELGTEPSVYYIM